ncbi:MAG: GNAT family N-acetyltransferase [Candidatus Omnitrophica bacterium]|nr:GNAT family N-acetyltransferase [Candidatus Omnitrophota bacterium]
MDNCIHTSTTLKSKIVRSILEVSVSDWESVYPHAIEGYAFFKTLEQSNMNQFSFSYCLVYDGSTLVGVAPFFTMDFHIDIAVQGILRNICKAIKNIFPRIMIMKTLFCGLPMGQGRIGLQGAREKILECIWERMEEMARHEKASILVFKDFNDSYTNDLQLLLKRGFLRSHSLPSTAINIAFDNFEGYLKTLSSSSREGLRRKFKKMAKDNPPIHMEVVVDLDKDTASQIHALYLQTALRSNIEFEVLPLDFFIHAWKNLSQGVRFFLWRTEDRRIIAFAFCLAKDDYFVDYYLGFDYSVAHEYNLYLVRFRGLLEWCIANKMKTYEMGQSSYEIKRRLGFQFIPLYVYTKPCNKLLAPFFIFHHKFLMFERFDPVFKQMYKEGAVFQ